MKHIMKSKEELLELLIDNPVRFHCLCRLCLSSNTVNGKPLQSHGVSGARYAPLIDKVLLYTAVRVQDDDRLPNTICDQCYQILKIVDDFRNKSQQVERLLKKVYAEVIDCKENFSTKFEDKASPTKYEHGKNHNDVSENNDHDCLSTDSENSLLQRDLKGEEIIYDQDKYIESSTFSSVENEEITQSKLELNFNFFSSTIKSEEINSNCLVNTATPITHINKLDEVFICNICRKPLKRKKSLETHIRNVHSEQKRKKEVGLVSGIGVERRYHCTECNYITKYKVDLVIHMRRHTGEKPYKCKTCTKSFAQQSTLNNHMKTHSDTMYFTCPHCGKQFKYKYKYEKHKNAHTHEEKYFCTICSKGLKSPKILEEHMNRHYNIKNYNCETCGSTFVTFSEMSIHSRIHGTEKRFKCHLCEYKTFVKASLIKHVRRHTGERPFVCEICQWKCYTRGELKVHTRTHTKEKNYSCPLCRGSFKTSSALNKHVIRTHGVKYKWSDHKDRRIVK